MVKSKTWLLALPLLAAASACAPELDDRTFLVQAPRVLAVQTEPAEGRPGAELLLRALLARPEEAAEAPALRWSFCKRRKPLAELGPIHPACVEDERARLAIGDGLEVRATLPAEACRNFGPDLPEPGRDASAGRPVDPDASGGYYQPVMLMLDDAEQNSEWILAKVRLACGLAGATSEQLVEYNRRYHPNTNPTIERLSIQGASGDEQMLFPADPPSGANTVAPGETLSLRATWPACDEAPCEGAEPYLVLDPQTRELRPRMERIRVSWYTTAGHFERDTSDGGTGETPQVAENKWTAPETPGPLRLWLVIRDDRGGASWQEYRLTVAAP